MNNKYNLLIHSSLCPLRQKPKKIKSKYIMPPKSKHGQTHAKLFTIMTNNMHF